MRTASRRLSGRIPGRPGLWELVLDGNRIDSLRRRKASAPDERGSWITPGLFDLQVNGIGGIHFTDAALRPEMAARADELLRAGGVSRYCPTLISCSEATARSALSTFARAWEEGLVPGAWGIHLEGPWISATDGARGVHRREHVREVSLAEWGRLQEAASGRIRILTVAPELPGAIGLIARASKDGVVVSLGHTEASAAVVAEAVRAGARMSTHLFNGCPQMLDRHSNVVFSQLAEDSLVACFIADGHHVPLSTLRLAMRAKGLERCILVSDLAHLSGLPEGDYEMEGNLVELRNGGLRVKGTSLLSGAARTLAEDVQVLAAQPEPGLEAALLMATRTPARLTGETRWAELEPGRIGPIAVFSWDGRHLALEQRIAF